MIALLIEDFKKRILGKSLAYNQVFSRESIYTHQVLEDLAKFCRAHDSTFHTDARVHATLEGRREVWLRIQEYLSLDIEEIYELHRVKEIIREKTVAIQK